MPDQPDDFFVKSEDVCLKRPRDREAARAAWSFEVEARPFGENR